LGDHGGTEDAPAAVGWTHGGHSNGGSGVSSTHRLLICTSPRACYSGDPPDDWALHFNTSTHTSHGQDTVRQSLGIALRRQAR
jgi:hypothetical protein